MNIQLIPVYLIIGFIGFRLLLGIFYPLFVLIHELGHAVPAKLFGKKQIQVVIGESPYTLCFALFGIEFNFSIRGLNKGYTHYKGIPSSWFEFVAIIAIAPLISLSLTLLGVYLWKTTSLSPALYFIFAAAWLANFHITFSALWPFSYSSNTQATLDQEPQSDLRALIKGFKQDK